MIGILLEKANGSELKGSVEGKTFLWHFCLSEGNYNITGKCAENLKHKFLPKATQHLRVEGLVCLLLAGSSKLSVWRMKTSVLGGVTESSTLNFDSDEGNSAYLPSTCSQATVSHTKHLVNGCCGSRMEVGARFAGSIPEWCC